MVIVGAGPAGLKCAETLGDSKFKVLLIEKNQEIGPKVCAGGLTEKGVKYLNLPKRLIDFNCKKIKIHINNSCLTIKHKDNLIYTIDRRRLGQWQLKKLKKFKNIEIRTNSLVSEIKRKYVVVDNQKIYYKFLVGADGSASIVKRFFGIKSKHIGITFQYVIPTKKYRELEIFLDSKLFSQWYAWIFPHENYVSIGCVGDPNKVNPKQLSDNFEKWMDKHKIDVSKARYESFILDGDYQGYKFGNKFLIGDAGGFVSELTGEGIYPALVTGEEVSKIIMNPDYKSKKIDDLLKIKNIYSRMTDFLVNCGRYRTIIFYMGVGLLRIPFIRKKAIKLFA